MKKEHIYDFAECAAAYSDVVETLGEWYKTKIYLDTNAVCADLEKFNNNWRIFNPSSGISTRWGLSLTSFHGEHGQENQPDLTSLDQYKKETGEFYHDVDFDVPTVVYNSMPSLKPLIEQFDGNFCRFHFLRFDRGARFTFHRDIYFEPYAFRMIAGIKNCSYPDYCLIINDRAVDFTDGTVNFFNAAIPHAAFATTDNTIQLVINVKINTETIKSLQKNC